MTSRPIVRALPVILALLCGAPRAEAEGESCTAADYAAAVDRSGAQLSAVSREQQPKIQERMRTLQKLKGLAEDDFESAALEAIQDKTLEDLDARSSELLLKIDGMGRLPEGKAPSCAELTDIDNLGAELLTVVRKKSAYILQRLDAEIAKSGAGKTAKAGPAPATTPPPGAVAESKEAKEGKEAKETKETKETKEAAKDEKAAPKPAKEAAPKPPPPAKEAAPAAKPPAAETWSATALPDDSYKPGGKAEAGASGSAVPAPIPAGAPDATTGYSIEEVQEATRGFFGTISTSLASVIEHAFKTSGRPTAYVLGTEGGGAFLAGLRFGEGTLYMRNHPETRKVWWHGPSIGGDFGASGTRTMFLIYKLPDHQALYRTFTGVDGSAFFVGGVGMTVLKGGDVIMAPIRTGLGLRVGASLGYVRFTAKPTWNPF